MKKEPGSWYQQMLSPTVCDRLLTLPPAPGLGLPPGPRLAAFLLPSAGIITLLIPTCPGALLPVDRRSPACLTRREMKQYTV